MEIVQYVRWTELGERERLQEVMQQCSGEMEFRKKVASEFNISPMDAAIVVKDSKMNLSKYLKQKDYVKSRYVDRTRSRN